MIILDTNVVSEPLRSSSDPTVIAWLDRQAPETLFITSINLAELLLGVELLSGSKRKLALDAAISDVRSRLFAGRILPFDERAAQTYASVSIRARQAGCPLSIADGQIAAIAIAHGFSVATRDEQPFHAAGVTVINPWRASLR